MQKLSTIAFFFTIISNIFAQSYANEWINFEQHYLKIVTNSKGIYKITKNDLDILGSELSQSNPQKFQLFYRGQQVDIEVTGQTDGSFDTNDEIHFYGYENDGALDVELYRPKVRPHPYVSLYSNETAFFLTAGLENGQRTAVLPYQSNTLPITTYYYEELLRVYENQWILDPAWAQIFALNSTYQQNETLISQAFYTRTFASPNPLSYTENIPLTNYLTGTNKNVDIEVMVGNRVGITNNYSYNFGNGAVGNFSMDGVFSSNSMKKQTSTHTTIVGNSVSLNIASTSNSSVNNDFWGVFYRKVNFPASFSNVFNRIYKLYPEAANNTAVIQFTENANNLVWDITDPTHVKILGFVMDGANQKYSIEGVNVEKKIWVGNTLKTPKKLSKVVFENISRNIYDYLLITDSRTKAGADRYKSYRETNMGGNYKVYVAETQKLYDQFAFGERTPIALKRFIAYMSTQIQIKNLFLVGQSVSFPSKLKTKELANQPDDEYVPTFGYPASDVQLSSEINGAGEYNPSIPTGRLVVNSDTEIDQYLAKVKQHDTRTNSGWQQNILSITGGRDNGEFNRFNTITNDGVNFALNSPYNFSTFPLINYTASTTNYPNIGISDPSLYTNVNNGVGLLTYFGHGNVTNTQYNFGLVSASTTTGGVPVGGPLLYQNQGKLPLLIAVACDVGNAYKGSTSTVNKTNNSMMTDWVNHPTLGAINAISHTYLGYESSSGSYFNNLMETLFESNQNYFGSVGDIWKKTNLKFGQNPNISGIIYNSIQEQTTLLGDPANRIFYQKCNEFALDAESNLSGSWASPETWTCGVEPNLGLNVKILPGHIVNLPTGTIGYGSTIDVKGRLNIENGAELKLENGGN